MTTDDKVLPLRSFHVGVGVDSAALRLDHDEGTLIVSARSDTLREMAAMILQAADALDDERKH